MFVLIMRLRNFAWNGARISELQGESFGRLFYRIFGFGKFHQQVNIFHFDVKIRNPNRLLHFVNMCILPFFRITVPIVNVNVRSRLRNYKVLPQRRNLAVAVPFFNSITVFRTC